MAFLQDFQGNADPAQILIQINVPNASEIIM